MIKMNYFRSRNILITVITKLTNRIVKMNRFSAGHEGTILHFWFFAPVFAPKTTIVPLLPLDFSSYRTFPFSADLISY